jgi:hypothetical protein
MNFGKRTVITLSLSAMALASQLTCAEEELNNAGLNFKTYGYDTLDQGEIELVYWTGYVVDSDNQMKYFGKEVDRNGLWNHLVEIEYGITDRWTIAAYADFMQPDGEDLKLVQAHVVGVRYRFFEKGERYFDPTFYVEYYLPRKSYLGENKEKVEARIILQKDIGATSIKLNPKLEKVVSGPDVTEGLEFEYAASVYHEFTPAFEAGIEAYGTMGEFSAIKSSDEQTHYLMPALETKLGKELSWNVGVGFGLTEASDKTVVKSIIEWEL